MSLEMSEPRQGALHQCPGQPECLDEAAERDGEQAVKLGLQFPS